MTFEKTIFPSHYRLHKLSYVLIPSHYMSLVNILIYSPLISFSPVVQCIQVNEIQATP